MARRTWRCPGCTYELEELSREASTRCPECGAEWTRGAIEAAEEKWISWTPWALWPLVAPVVLGFAHPFTNSQGFGAVTAFVLVGAWVSWLVACVAATRSRFAGIMLGLFIAGPVAWLWTILSMVIVAAVLGPM